MSEHKGLYDISKPRFDLATYEGRTKYFYSTTSPLTLLASKTELKDAQAEVQRVEGRIREAGKSGLWVDEKERDRFYKAQQLVNSSIHPDTGEPVTLPFRMSAFVPTNLLICAGMLYPTTSLPIIVFFQWANQTLNVAVNYSNANKSIRMSNAEVGTAYLAATITSVGLAVGLTRAVPRLPFSQVTRQLLARLVPFVSVASAGVVNISCIRWKEMKDGVDVYKLSRDPETGEEAKQPLGKSAIAGQRAVMQSATSRVLTNIPTLIFPPLIMVALQNRGAFSGPRGKLVSNVTNLTLIGLALGLALPPAIAYFPQRASIDPKKLEKQFHEVDGEVYFNKGL